MSVEQWRKEKKTEELGENPAPVTLGPRSSSYCNNKNNSWNKNCMGITKKFE
jgi:hypothetical protein